MPAKQSPKKAYENNPFFIATNGITLLFNLAQGVAVMIIILSIFGLISGSFDGGGSSSAQNLASQFSRWQLADWLMLIGIVGIVGLAAFMIGSLFKGVLSYTSAQIAAGREVAIKTAFRTSFDRLWSFMWLQLIIFVKLLLWTLLFIIPGIIMAVRYTLASVVFFDDTKELRGNAAIKESLRLTKGAWLTTFASHTLLNILTLGAISSVIETGVNAVLYQQYTQAGDKKQPAHWLSWMTLVLPFVFLGILLSFVVFFILTSALFGILL